ncbi:hypothetical protein CALCODRAFT_497357 [Calocera cornea HHB12733]|uniref:Uncharacterized protein n=1 Tax=Calocera cornea HHB12733 TaxID=1353952 RepID=A0A165F9M3_9BASI|nr:hypothetical protein CALCODRAFT_497357 [Calocera cornea HHB12733]
MPSRCGKRSHPSRPCPSIARSQNQGAGPASRISIAWVWKRKKLQLRRSARFALAQSS